MQIKVMSLFSKDFYDAFQRLLKLKMTDLNECIKLIKLARAFENERKTYLDIKDKLFSDFNYISGEPIVGELEEKMQQFLESDFEIENIDKIIINPEHIIGEISAGDLLLLSDILEI